MKKEKNIRTIIFLTLLFLPAIGLRLYLILRNAPAADEIWVLFLMKASFKDIWIGAISDSNAPLYYLFLHALSALFGGQLNILIYRFLSFFFGILASLAVGYLAYSLLGKKAAMITLILTLFLPSFIWTSVFGRYYSFLILLTALTLIFFVRFTEKGRILPLVMLVAASTLGLYTHYYFPLLILSLTIFLFSFKKYKSLLVKWFSALLTLALLCAPLFYSFLLLPKYQVANINNSLLKIPAVFLSQITSFHLLAFVYKWQTPRLPDFYVYLPVFGGLFPIALLLFIRGVKNLKNDLRYFLLISLLTPPMVLLGVSYLVRPSFAVNSFLIFSPAFLLILAKGIEIDLAKKKILTFIFILLVLVIFIPFSRSFILGADFAKPFLYVKNELQDRDVALHSEMYTFVGARYYLGEGINFGANPTLTTKETERIHGYKIISEEELLHQKGRIWYFQPWFYNVLEAQAGKSRLDNSFELVKEKEFKESIIKVYLYEPR